MNVFLTALFLFMTKTCEGKTLLIIHADDAGNSLSANTAIYDAAVRGTVTSASIMIPAPWIPDIAERQRLRPIDLGVHATLNSEFKNMKWRPISWAPSLCDEFGFMWHFRQEVQKYADSNEVEQELDAQITLAKKLGLDPSHIDTHMAAHFLHADFLRSVIKLAKKHEILPFLLRPGSILNRASDLWNLPHDEIVSITTRAEKEGFPILDSIHLGATGSFQEMMASYETYIRNLPDGLHQIILHPSLFTEESKQLLLIAGEEAGSHSRAKRRHADYQIAISARFKKTIEKAGVELTSWRALLNQHVKRQKQLNSVSSN